MLRLATTCATLLLAATTHAAFAQPDASAGPGSASNDASQQAWVIVTDATERLRCGNGVAYYPVAKLEQGQPLRVVDRSDDEWLGVAYPNDAIAIVLADQVTAAAPGTVTLTSPSRLIALHDTRGERASWAKLLPEPLPTGATLQLAQDDTPPSETWIRVRPPEGAVGYLRKSKVRPATREEVDAYFAAPAVPVIEQSAPTDAPANEPRSTDAGPADEPPADPISPQSETTTPETTTPDATPAPAEPEPAQPVEATNPFAPEQTPPPSAQTPQPAAGAPTTPASAPVTTNPFAPVGTQATPDQSDPSPAQPTPTQETPAQSTQAQPAPAPAPDQPENTQPETAQPEQAPPPAQTPRELDSAFRRVSAQPTIEAEFAELIAEYDRTLAQSDLDDATRETLDRQRRLLAVRADLQAERRANEQARRSAEGLRSEADTRVASYLANLPYDHIGRLSRSAVFAGQGLPSLFRLTSVDPQNEGATVVYVRADDPTRLQSRVGQIIGIRGTLRREAGGLISVLLAETIDPVDITQAR